MDTPRYETDNFRSEEDEAFIADVPDPRYCSAWEETYEDVLREVRVAIELHLDTLREAGRPIPTPERRAIAG